MIRGIGKCFIVSMMAGLLVACAVAANNAELAPVAATIAASTVSAVAVVHGFVQNQGDAWTVTGAYLDRFIEEQRGD